MLLQTSAFLILQDVKGIISEGLSGRRTSVEITYPKIPFSFKLSFQLKETLESDLHTTFKKLNSQCLECGSCQVVLSQI